MRRVVFRNSGAVTTVTEMCERSKSTNLDLNGQSLLLREDKQRNQDGRPDREYLATYIAPAESSHEAPGLGPGIVFRSSIGAPL